MYRFKIKKNCIDNNKIRKSPAKLEFVSNFKSEINSSSSPIPSKCSFPVKYIPIPLKSSPKPSLNSLLHNIQHVRTKASMYLFDCNCKHFAYFQHKWIICSNGISSFTHWSFYVPFRSALIEIPKSLFAVTLLTRESTRGTVSVMPMHLISLSIASCSSTWFVFIAFGSWSALLLFAGSLDSAAVRYHEVLDDCGRSSFTVMPHDSSLWWP